MGNRIAYMIIRPFRNFDVERRAHKAISKEKPTLAPQYEASKRQLKMAQELNPDFLEKHYEKDSKLNAHLKDVFVVADDPKPDLSNKSDPKKPLPHIRKSYQYEDLNLYQIENVREGRCSVQQLQKFLTDHINDPQKHNATIIAEQYKLDINVVENLLEYYKLFRIITKEDIQKIGEDVEKRQKIDDRR